MVMYDKYMLINLFNHSTNTSLFASCLVFSPYSVLPFRTLQWRIMDHFLQLGPSAHFSSRIDWQNGQHNCGLPLSHPLHTNVSYCRNCQLFCLDPLEGLSFQLHTDRVNLVVLHNMNLRTQEKFLVQYQLEFF